LGSDVQEILQKEETENWWHDAFSNALKNVSHKKKRKKSTLDPNDATASAAAPTFEDLFRATGGARLGMRARAQQQGKLQRTENLEQNNFVTETVIPEAVTVGDGEVGEKERKKKKRKEREVEKEMNGEEKSGEEDDELCHGEEEKREKKKRRKESSNSSNNNKKSKKLKEQEGGGV
jgi:Pin2-interacting protein X1